VQVWSFTAIGCADRKNGSARLEVVANSPGTRIFDLCLPDMNGPKCTRLHDHGRMSQPPCCRPEPTRNGSYNSPEAALTVHDQAIRDCRTGCTLRAAPVDKAPVVPAERLTWACLARSDARRAIHVADAPENIDGYTFWPTSFVLVITTNDLSRILGALPRPTRRCIWGR
jgi:hypothetical protein